MKSIPHSLLPFTFSIAMIFGIVAFLMSCTVEDNNSIVPTINPPDTSTCEEKTTSEKTRYNFFTDENSQIMQSNTLDGGYSSTMSTALKNTGGANNTNEYYSLQGANIGSWAAGGWTTGTKNLSDYTTLVFWAKSATETQIRFAIEDGTKATVNEYPEISTPINGTWTKYTLSFDALGVTDSTNINVLKYVLPSISAQIDIDEVYFEGTASVTNTCPSTTVPSLGDAHERYTKYQLIKQYEFNDTNIDTKNWSFDTDAEGNNVGWGNGEAQYYTDRSTNSYISDNTLVIEAKAENLGGKSFTSARLHTDGKFSIKYGIIEARIKLPQNDNGQTDVATFPALWMLGDNFDGWGHNESPFNGTLNWPSSGEIDILESNQHPNGYSRVLSTLHWNSKTTDDAFSGAARTYKGGSSPITNATSEYHSYLLKWSESQLEFFLDGSSTPFHTHTIDTNGTQEEFKREFFLLVNLAVGGPGTGFTGGQTADTSKYPQKMFVDWIRIYQDPDDTTDSYTDTTN